MASLEKQDMALISNIRDEFNAQPCQERFRTGRFMTMETVVELLRERTHAMDTVARINKRIAALLEAERRREPAATPTQPTKEGESR